MDSLGISVSPEGIVQVLEKLSSYLNKDKNAFCLALFLTYASIERSYNNLVKALAPMMAGLMQGKKPLEVEPRGIPGLMEYLLTSSDSGLVQDCSDYIKDVDKRYQHGELKKMADKIEIHKLRTLSDLLDKYWSNLHDTEVLAVGLLQSMDFRMLQEWLSKQDAIRDQIRQTVSQIQNDLGCQNDKIQMLWTRFSS